MIWRIALTALAAVDMAAAQKPAFEVASVKPSSEAGGKISITRDRGGGITALNIQLENLILLTYHVQRYQLKGEPRWAQSERFDVAAKAPAGASQDQTWAMMQALLEERFLLAAHRETVEMPVYLLVPAKGGLRIRPAERPREEIDGFFTSGRGRIRLQMAPLEQLAFALSDVLGRCVRERSGSQENFDLQLQWTAESPEGPNLMAALQEQLGLKLEGGRGPVEVVVIDRAERPSGN
jgi:uncharacterized protein (TIGR03435 family)